MTAEELRELTKWVLDKKAETQKLEVKSAHEGCPTRLYDTLSSFSNQDSGGILLFGIDEKQNFALVGVGDLQGLQKGVTEQCRQMEPAVRPYFTCVEFEGKDICSAEIPGVDLSERPCYYKGAGRLKGAFVRVGDADEHMTEYELYRYEAFRRHLHDDERTSERARLTDLDKNRLERYLSQRKAERPGFAQLPRERMLELLGVVREGKPTLAALLNFSPYPQGIFPQLCITAVVIPGREMAETTESGVRFLDNRRIEGTLSEMVEEAISFCKRNMKTETVIDSRTGERRDRTEYPVMAIREAVLNAVIHRDYSEFTEGTPVQMLLFSDRLEIHSPGTLYGRLTVEQLGIARPDLRNPVLATMAESLTRAENRYSGIPTMRREMKMAGLPAPQFENRRNEFVVTLYSERTQSEGHPAQNVPAEQEALLAYCATPRSRQEIAQFLGLTSVAYVTRKYLSPWVASGVLTMTMPDKPRSRYQRYYAMAKRS